MDPSTRVVLVVEDDWLVRVDIVNELHEAGWNVLEASTAEGALEVLHHGAQVDVLITDIQLAGHLSGWDVAEGLRNMRPDAAVIYVSGNSVERARQVSHSLFFDKPYSTTAILEACCRLTEAPICTESDSSGSRR
jgi:CheY-like chemotaxis protein